MSQQQQQVPNKKVVAAFRQLIEDGNLGKVKEELVRFPTLVRSILDGRYCCMFSVCVCVLFN